MKKGFCFVLLMAFILSACAPTATPQPTMLPATATPTATPVDPIKEISFADLAPEGFHEGWSWIKPGRFTWQLVMAMWVDPIDPQRVQQSLCPIFALIGNPARYPKPRGKSPGWTKGRRRTTKPRFAVVKKTATAVKTA